MVGQTQMIMFMKNLFMLGGALLITQFGAEPLTDMPKIAIVSGSTSTGWKNRAAAKWAPGRG